MVTSPFSFVASADPLLCENARPVFCDMDPAHAETLTRRPPRQAGTERTTTLFPVHVFGYPADMPAFERLAAKRSLWSWRTRARHWWRACGRRPGWEPRPPRHLRLYPEHSSPRERVAPWWRRPPRRRSGYSEANQGRAPDMGWLDHDRLGFNYRLDELSCALGLAQLQRLDDMLAARARVLAHGEALATSMARVPRRTTGRPPHWFVYVVQVPPEIDRDTAIRALRRTRRGLEALPAAIHLMSLYRDRFGHREGEFWCARTWPGARSPSFLPPVDRGRGGPGGGGRRAVVVGQPAGTPVGPPVSTAERAHCR